MIVRHKLLADLVRLWKNDQLVEKIDRLPIELSPRKSKPLGRCCVHKERAVWRYKTFPLMGLDMTDEHDEVTPLSEYARMALDRPEPSKENIMCVIDEACSSCVQINYEITNLCRGCVARSCYMNCPKDAIRFKKNGQAMIDHDTCVSCGICHKSCPYHAIVYIPVPCEESCPVKAIKKDEHGVEYIDESKCIYCGKCMNACPFGAIFEISQTFDVLQRIKKGEKMVAIIAPSILGQFKTSIEQVYGAFKEIGFTDIIEVAEGAMMTTSNEAHELLEKLEEGQKFMTTSCCPSYIELVEKHLTEMKPYVSTTGSPMYYAARIAKEKHPDAKIVFVGPCVAKRKEVRRDEAVDYILTFEEVGSILDGMDIQLEQVDSFSILHTSVREAHGFAQAGGVMGAVKAYLKEEADKINAIQVSDINKKNIALLRACAKTGKAAGQFIEVMACEGGCITGPSTHNDIVSGRRQLVQELLKRKERTLRPEEFRQLLTECDGELLRYINEQAQEVSLRHFGNRIFIRGLIEVSNCCRNNCYYCGIRKGNPNLERYRLTAESILDCCKQGYELGFRTFVLQGGEDPVLTDERIENIVSAIHRNYPDCAITLSLGEKPREAYERFFQAGANRYLLRHETYDKSHYRQLHPEGMSCGRRLQCLQDLKEIGYQTGTGIMVGSPGQTVEHLIQDILFIEQLRPEMIGIGPFLPHRDTPFAQSPCGTVEQTILLLSIFRLMHPSALIPATTALATLTPDGRERGILAGANVVMPNLSPQEERKKYNLYNNKASLGAESAEGLRILQQQLENIGYQISFDRGDYKQ